MKNVIGGWASPAEFLLISSDDAEGRPVNVKVRDRSEINQSAAASGCCHRERPRAGLTDAAADRQAVLLRLKVIPVASAAAVDKLNAAALLSVKVPAGQHGPARTCLCTGPAHVFTHKHIIHRDEKMNQTQDFNRRKKTALQMLLEIQFESQ